MWDYTVTSNKPSVLSSYEVTTVLKVHFIFTLLLMDCFHLWGFTQLPGKKKHCCYNSTIE